MAHGSTILGTNLIGEQTSFLTLTNVQMGQAGIYRAVVRNAANPAGIVTSNAVLTVLADTDGDGAPDDWELAHGLSATDGSDEALDSDGDGFTNLQEYLAGTDPEDPQSLLRIDKITWSNQEGASLCFVARSNKTYTVLSSTRPGGALWTRIADVPATATNRIVVIKDPATALLPTHRVYRVATPRLGGPGG